MLGLRWIILINKGGRGEKWFIETSEYLLRMAETYQLFPIPHALSLLGAWLVCTGPLHLETLHEELLGGLRAE